MRELSIMLNMRAVAFLTTVLEKKWQTLLKNLSSIIIFGGFAVGVFYLTRFTTLYLLQEANIGQFLFHRFLSMLLYVFFVTVNLGNMIVSYATLYKSQEVSFLMALPISHAKIFLLKFVDNFFYSSTTLSLIGIAILLGYGSCFVLPWYFYFFTIFFVIIPFMLVAGLTAVMILMSLIKVATKIGIRWLLGLIVTVYLAAIYLYFRVTNPMKLVEEVMKYYPNINEYFGYLDPPLTQYLPNHWVSEFLYWSVRDEVGRAIPYFVILFLTMLAMVILAGLMARRYYYDSWHAATDARAMAGSSPRVLRFKFLEFGSRSFFKAPVDVLLKRDFWLFWREPSQWLHLFLMSLLLMIFLVSVATLELKLVHPFLRAVSYLVVLMFNGFLIASITLRFVFPAVSLEGDAFWSVRSSPVSLKRLYWLKFTVAFGLVLGMAELLAVTSTMLLRHGSLLIVLASVSAASMALALTGLNLGAGAYFAMFKEKNPIRVASSQGASLTFLVGMVYLTLVAAVLIVPLNRYFEVLMLSSTVQMELIYVPLLIVASLSAILFSVSTGVGLRAIHRDL